MSKTSAAQRFLLIFLLLLLLQLPFLQADADLKLGFSRGPFTDEGLYTAQIRNFITSGTLNLAESDALMKAPLFGALTWLVTGIFGDSMVAMRSACMVISSLLLAAAAAGPSHASRRLLLGVPLVMLSYFPFQHGHLSLAEPICFGLIVVAVLLTSLRISGGGPWTAAGSALAACLAFGFKVQYFYVPLIPIGAFAIDNALFVVANRRIDRRKLLSLAIAILVSALLLILFAVIWVIPHQDMFFTVFLGQASARSSDAVAILDTVKLNIASLIFSRQVLSQSVLLATSFLFVILYALFSRKKLAIFNDDFLATFIPLACWALLETHKLALAYFPSRYFFTLLASASLAALVLLMECLGTLDDGDWRVVPRRGAKYGVVVALLLVFALNAFAYLKALSARTFVIHEAQRQLAASGEWRGKVVLGPWAPTLFWGTHAIAKPVWAGFFNDRNILALHPAAIVTEPDQADSIKAFQRDGVNFPGSPRYSYRIANWRVDIHTAYSQGPTLALPPAPGPTPRIAAPPVPPCRRPLAPAALVTPHPPC